MNSKTHREATDFAFPVSSGGNANYRQQVIKESAEVDNYRDLEFVDVQSARDDPHNESNSDDNDHARYEFEDQIYTAFNHFIDIKKANALFDDYDGYSYRKGSASKGEYQDADDAKRDWRISLLTWLTGHKKVDDALAYWFNDEYVHAPGQPWYQACSPAIERYSYPADQGRYTRVEAELAARFPLAEKEGKKGLGIPWSVFMPLDNLARYWYDLVLFGNYSLGLGPVMHAIQDASIPHHAAGTNGNWHARYENDVDDALEGWQCSCGGFRDKVDALYDQWMQSDTSQPDRLTPADWRLVPSVSWRIDYLVTWVALNAYRVYDQTYQHFRNGYRFDVCSAQELTQIAIAMSALALSKVTQDKGKLTLIGLSDRQKFNELYGVKASLRSINYPDRFVRHANFLGELTPLSTSLDAQDATFKVVWGLADPNDGVSLESVNYPGHYLRHQGGRIRLDREDGSQLFKEEATFRLRPGLANRLWSSLESFNRPGWYIRHRGFHLHLDPMAGDPAIIPFFHLDATFLLRQPWQSI